MPVKSPDTTELYYKKNLCDIVKACGASFILSNLHLFKGHEDSRTSTLTRLMEATTLEWFCVSPQGGEKGEAVLEDAPLERVEEEENCEEQADYEEQPAAESGVDQGGQEQAAVELVKEGREQAPVELDQADVDLEEGREQAAVELDGAKSADVAYMQFTTTGMCAVCGASSDKKKRLVFLWRWEVPENVIKN